MMTTIVDHNDIRLQPIKRVIREARSPEARCTDRYAVTLRGKAERLTSAFDEQHK